MLAHSIRTIVVAILPHSYIRHLIPGAENTETRRIKQKWDHSRRINLNRSSTGTGTSTKDSSDCPDRKNDPPCLVGAGNRIRDQHVRFTSHPAVAAPIMHG